MPSARSALPAVAIRRTAIAITTALALIAGLWAPAQAAPRPDDPLWTARKEKSVPGKNAQPIPVPADPAAQKAIRTTPKVVWPAAGSAQVALPAATSTVAGGTDWAALLAGGSAAGPKARAGALPVWIGTAATTAATAATKTPAPAKVGVELTRPAADRLLLKLSRADGVRQTGKVSLRLDYQAFRDAYGGDWALRLRLLQLPACALTRPGTPQCAGTVVPTANNGSGSLTGDVQVPAAGTDSLYAVQAGPSGGTGDFGASALAPSATWQIGGSSGDFSWNYPMAAPPSDGGPAPQLALGYSSGGVDGRTATTNNQPSWVGQGFEFQPGGSIERRYASCASKSESTGNNGTRVTGDLCFATDNATFTLNGKGGELVRDDATGTWHPRVDDGSKVERLHGAVNNDEGRTTDDTGEYWRLTTKDGTEYYFGLNKLPGATTQRTNSSWTVPVFGNHSGEQCYTAGNFAASWCQQAYKWNLDYVVDRHGNTMSLYYDTETGYYGRNSTATAVSPYTRGGNIRRIEYGQRLGELYTTPAVGQVQFATTERCLDGSGCATAADYPDTPLDQRCIGTGGQPPTRCDNKFNPVFFTTKKLSKVTTEIWRGTAFAPVSSWTMRYTFPDNGDGTKPGLWLAGITNAGHVGNTGGVTIPEVTFGGLQLANRVDAAGDHLPPMNWWRINRISYGMGGDLGITYYPKDCGPGDVPAPDTNGRRCHPMKWTPPGSTTERTDWFHKYVVQTVTETDRVAQNGATPEPTVTTVEYPNAPAWRHDDEDGLVEIGQKTWSQWRGYDLVRQRKGNPGGPQVVTESRYFRGMDGDQLAGGGVKRIDITDSTGGKAADLPALAGQLREQDSFDGATLVDRTITDQWVSLPTATRVRSWGTTSAYQVQEAGNRQDQTITGSTLRKSSADNTYDASGLLLRSNDLNDLATPDDDTCTRYQYVKNDALGIDEMPKSVQTVSVSCDKSFTAADVLSDDRTYYDGATSVDTAPTKGDVTKTERLTGFDGAGTPQYQTTGTIQYDALGRSVKMSDAKNQSSTTSYTPAGAGPVTKVVSTKPNGDTTTIELEPAWGEQVATTDEAGKRTEAAYDPLGRTTKVWYPGRSGAVAPALKSGNVAGIAATADNAAVPDVEYSYGILANAPSSVTTKSLQTDGSIDTSYELYDGLMRPRQTQEAAPGGGRVVNDWLYDSRGLEVKENGPYYNDAPPVPDAVLIADDAAMPTQKVTDYDLAGRPKTEIFMSEGQTKWQTTHSYTADSESVDPPAGDTPTTRITDVQGRLLELRQYTGAGPSGTYDSTRYTYTKAGQLESVTDPSGNKSTYHYDLRGRQLSATDPDRGTTTYTYDELDRVATQTDQRGVTLAYAYDSIGRRTELHQDSLQGPLRAKWTYDTLLRGMPTSSTRFDAQGNAYTSRITGYDDAGRATGTAYDIPDSEGKLAGTYEFDTTYNTDGQVQTDTLPGIGGLPAETLTYGYDAKDQPKTMSSATTTYVRDTSYTPFGEVEKITLGATGGKWVQMGYEYETGSRRLSRVVTDRETLPRRISDVQYGYDDSGNITKISDAPSSTSGEQTDTQCFTYDYLLRMTSAWTPKPGTGNAPGDCSATPKATDLGGPAPYWQAWSFDKTGNRRTETKTTATGSTTATYNYPASGPTAVRPHAVQSVVTTGTGMPTGGRTDSYGYDETGNQKTRTVAGTGETYSWNAEGDLDKVTKNGQDTSFLYDANGNRLIRRDSSGTTLYVDDTELLLKPGAAAAEGTRYYKHGEQTVAVRTASALTWLGADHHGTSTTSIDNTAAQNVQRRREDPYGNLRGTAPVSWPGQRAFVGGTGDPSTGLVHLGAREYDPTTGRFISVDPQVDVEDPQTLNAYAYGNNNPVTFSDPDGQSWFSSIVSSVVHVAETVVTRTVDTVKQAVHVVTPVINWVKDRVKDTVSAIKTFVHKTVEVVKKVVKTIKKVVKKVIRTVKKVVKKVAEVTKKAVAKVKQVAKAIARTAKAVAHKVAAVAVKAATWVYEHRDAILEVVGEIALTVAIGALTGGVGALAVRGAMTALRLASSAKRLESVAKVADNWPKISGIVRDAAKGKGNFGVGEGTRAEAETAGKAWVGDGARASRNGKAMVSQDGLRQYRPPSIKPRRGSQTQANFESRWEPRGEWQTNGHLDITDP